VRDPADLPSAVVECFRSPLEIQHRHAEQLAGALESDRKGVLRRAEKLRQAPHKSTGGAVVAALLGNAVQGDQPLQPQPLLVGGKPSGKWART
jgi:ParB family chromosome partitioning protein